MLDAPFVALQAEMHSFLRQEELVEWAQRHESWFVACSPLAKGAVLDHPVLTEIADRHEVSQAQVSLAWLRAKGVAAIPKATGRDHLADNWASLDLALTDEEIARIDGVDREERLVHPDFAPDAW